MRRLKFTVDLILETRNNKLQCLYKQVIDLTDRKGSEESEISKQQRDREQFLQQQRDLMMRNTLQVSEGKLLSMGNLNLSSIHRTGVHHEFG
jgi:hypothetical protein